MLTARYSIQLDPALGEDLSEWAIADQRPVSNLLRLIVSTAIERWRAERPPAPARKRRQRAAQARPDGIVRPQPNAP